jgi:hypothetical protein
MNTQHFVSNEKSGRESLHRVKRTPIVLSAMTALCLLLGGHSTQARINLDRGDTEAGSGDTPKPPPTEVFEGWPGFM